MRDFERLFFDPDGFGFVMKYWRGEKHPRFESTTPSAPSLKLATNSDIYRRMEEDMDINCGDVLDGVSLEQKGREIFDAVLRTASGAPTKSEALGYGDAEFVPWQIGAVM